MDRKVDFRGKMWGNISALAAVLGFCLPSVLLSCPIFLFPSLDLPLLKGQETAKIKLFSIRSGFVWQEEPFQIDQLDENGGISFPKEKEVSKKIGENDRLVFSANSFGRKKPDYLDFPCKASVVYEIIDYLDQKQANYLIFCHEAFDSKGIKRQAPLFSKEDNILFSPNYSFQFNKNNQLLFDQIALGEGKKRALAAFFSNMAIFADVKGFFSVLFGPREIQSKIVTMAGGDVGVNTNLSFFLKMLFFKINLSLSTDVSFYNDSVYLPMVLYFPVDAKKYLHPTSGLLYHWALAEKFQEEMTVSMPEFSAATFTKEANNKDVIAKFCQKKYCDFSFGLTKPSPLVMSFRLDKELVASGFYPIFVDDIEKFNQVSGWGLTSFGKARHAGFLFSTVGLGEGYYSWSFWINALPEPNSKITSCPYPISLRSFLVDKNNR